MKFKNIEDLTAEEVNRLVATRILKEPWDPAKDYSGEWEHGGPVVDKYLIGSEGKSAWLWYKDRMYGMQGHSQLDACMKALLFSRYYSGWVGDGYKE